MLDSGDNDLKNFVFPVSEVSKSSFAFDQNFADKDLSLNNMLAKIKPCNYYNDPSVRTIPPMTWLYYILTYDLQTILRILRRFYLSFLFIRI